MEHKTKKIALSLFIILSIITVGIIASMRMKVESKNNKVEMIIEYEEANKLATQSHQSVGQWLVEFKNMGMNSVAIMEETLLQYTSNNAINFTVINLLFNNGEWERIYPEEVVNEINRVDPNSLLIEITREIDFETIVNGLSYYRDIKFWNKQIDDKYYIIVEQTIEDLIYADSNDLYNAAGKKIGTNKSIFGTEVLNVPIGYDREKVELIKKSGLNLMLRPTNYLNDPISAWNLFLGEVDRYGIGNNLLLFGGESVVGYGLGNNEYIIDIQQFIDNKNLNIGLVETMEQRQYGVLNGLNQVVNYTPKDKFVRVFNLWDFIANRYKYAYYDGAQEVGNSIYRAITERNIRAIYFRPFIKSNRSYVTDVEDYRKMFEDLEVRISKHGYEYGNATTFDEISLPIWVKILLTIEVLIFGLILLNYVIEKINFKINIVLFSLGCIGVFLAYYIMPNMSVSLTALGSAIIFSTLSITYFIKSHLLSTSNTNVFNSIKGVVVSCSISLLGALYIGSIMADTNYFLEIELFRGVKLSLLGPILLTILVVVFFYILDISKEKEGVFSKEFIETSKRFLNTSIKIKYAIVLGFVGIAGYIYLARSGNESGLDVMTLEIMFRNFLEDNLLARPRTKEFLIAFPAMIVGAYYSRLNILNKDKIIRYTYVLAFACIAAIGQSSIPNTFSHIRTPLYLSLVRTGYSIIFGIILGVIAILILKLLGIIFNKLKTMVQNRV